MMETLESRQMMSVTFGSVLAPSYTLTQTSTADASQTPSQRAQLQSDISKTLHDTANAIIKHLAG
jgi:hypothetical protein